MLDHRYLSLRVRPWRLLILPAGLLLGVVGAGLWPVSVAADTYPRQPGIDVLHYSFQVTVRDDSDEIAGEATIDIRFLENGLAGFALDFASASAGKGMTVSRVMSSGSQTRFEHKDDRLRVIFDSPPVAGQSRSFNVSYRGIPRMGLRIGKNRHGERTFFSENWPDKARGWLPMVDHPYDKATSEFLINAPARYQVVANGLLEEERDLGDGRRLTHWKESVPIASWLNAIGLAQFAAHHAGSVRGVPLETWVYHQDRGGAVPALEGPARRVLEFYIEHIGPYPYEKLANVEAAGLSGGTEHASAIFYGEYNLRGRGVTGLVAHEIAHQWFGDSVTERDWDDIWLSEGFATYFALLFAEHDAGRDAFQAGLERSRNVVFAVEKRDPELAVVHRNLSDTRRVLNGLVYQKGGWVLHMLRGVLGSDMFWSGIREYYKRYRDGNAATADFERVMEEISGQELSWFFRQWLNRPGSPELSGTWNFDPQQKCIAIELSQLQPGDLYRLPLEIGIKATGQDETLFQKIELKKRQGRFEIKVDNPPSEVTLDPNRWVLMKSSFQGSAAAK
jgi:aminopeptidase N